MFVYNINKYIIYTDEICAICNSRFVTKRELASHKRTHSSDRPFACIFGCPLRYKNDQSLARHLRDHHSDIYRKTKLEDRKKGIKNRRRKNKRR